MMNQERKENYYFKKSKKKNNKGEIKNEINNIMNNINNEELDENDFYLINLLSIILDDSQNYPNFSHIKTISNIEKFVILYFKKYNEIKLKYEFEEENINNNNEIELFGSKFVEKNKQKCFLIINEKTMEFNRLINLKSIFKKIPEINPIILDVRLIERKNQLMSDLSFMFSGISTIREINFDNYNSNNIKSMDFMFNNCSSIKELPDISSLNTKNVTNMSYIFNNCSSIKYLPDISKWDTRNVTNMSYMFYNCSSIENLPDISKWDTRNATNMSYMFYNCSSIKNLPDISKWDTRNVTDMSYMFNNCTSLELLPDISSWNIEKLENYSYMFGYCKSVRNLSILSELELKDDSQTEKIFQGCELFEEQMRARRNFSFCDCFYDIITNICNCYSKGYNYFCQFIGIILCIAGIILIIIILISPFVPLYSSFHIGKTDQQILNLKQEKNLTYYVNITHISSILKITNSSLIKEMSENKEGVIQNFLDEMLNKSNISSKQNKNTFKAYSIIIAIAFILNIIIFGLTALTLYFKNNKNMNIIFPIIFPIILILNSISLIFEILELLICAKFSYSIKQIKLKIERFFQIKFFEDYFSDFTYLSYALYALYLKSLMTLILIIMILYLCSLWLKKRENSKNYYNELLRHNK